MKGSFHAAQALSRLFNVPYEYVYIYNIYTDIRTYTHSSFRRDIASRFWSSDFASKPRGLKSETTDSSLASPRWTPELLEMSGTRPSAVPTYVKPLRSACMLSGRAGPY